MENSQIQNNQNGNQAFARPDANETQIMDILMRCLARWYWFVLAVAVCLGIAVFKILRTPPVYTRTATILIKETNTRRATTNDLEAVLANGGMGTATSKLVNEIVAFKSPYLMSDVVRRLNLDVEFASEGRFHNTVVYGTQVPVVVRFLDDPENLYGSLSISPVQGKDFALGDWTYIADRKAAKPKAEKSKKIITGMFGDTLSTPMGRMLVTRAIASTKALDQKLLIRKVTVSAAAARFSGAFGADQEDTKNHSDVLNLRVNDVNRGRGDDILNMTIAIYNENWVADRNLIAVSTSVFIKERLNAIEKDLADVDASISSYKSQNLIPDVEAVSNMYMSHSVENTRKIQDLDNKLSVTNYIRSYLASVESKDHLIPMGSSISNASIASEISEYNRLMITRNSTVASSSEKNPLVVTMDEALASMRNSIRQSIDTEVAALETTIANLHKDELENTRKLAANPDQAKYLLSVSRQQKVLESLYLYLLQKREENELSQAFSAYNTRVITPPTGSGRPILPKKRNILMIAFIIGLAIPFGIIYLKEVLDTKIRSRKDLENLTAPFLSEIPEWSMDNRSRRRFLKKSGTEDQPLVAVMAGNRDVVNEAFRVLRTNLEFISGDNSHPAFIITSFNPGSGKTFVSMNLSIALAIKKKKVLVVDCDLRRASLSRYVGSPKKGISDFLAGVEPSVESLMVKGAIDHPTLDVLPVGTIPPNPSELLGEKRFAQFVQDMKAQYDYVIMDCPPADIVADTQIISSTADRTIFIARAGLLDKTAVPVIDKIYNEKKFSNMSVVLNATRADDARYGYQYGYHRYGYRSYGYHSYGYGYGYYGSEGSKKKSKKA